MLSHSHGLPQRRPQTTSPGDSHLQPHTAQPPLTPSLPIPPQVLGPSLTQLWGSSHSCGLHTWAMPHIPTPPQLDAQLADQGRKAAEETEPTSCDPCASAGPWEARGPHRTPQTPQDPTDLCEVPCNRPLIAGWERAVSSCPVFSDGIDSGEQPAHARNDWAAPSSLWSTFLAAQHF